MLFRSPATLMNSKWHVLQAMVDLYWAVIDAGHAALMRIGQVPAAPEHVADLLEEYFVKTRKMHPKYPVMMRNFYHIMKGITHREIREFKGADYDRYAKDAAEFVNEMKKIVEGKIERQ